ncbi:hypothetical protein BDAP_002733 [Binucleata daphniae]
MLFLLQLVSLSFFDQQESLLATISFDEGPSKNIPAILEILDDMQVPASFYFDPAKIKDDDIVTLLLNKGHYVGLSIVDDLSEVDDVDSLIIDKMKMFVDKTGYIPKLVRLPRIGYTNETVRIAKSYNLIPTTPNLDSEDCDLENFMEPFTKFVNTANENLSVCFRDRMSITVKILEDAINVLLDNGYEIVSGSLYHNVENMLERVSSCKDKKEQSKTCSNNTKCSNVSNKLSKVVCPSQILANNLLLKQNKNSEIARKNKTTNSEVSNNTANIEVSNNTNGQDDETNKKSDSVLGESGNTKHIDKNSQAELSVVDENGNKKHVDKNSQTEHSVVDESGNKKNVDNDSPDTTNVSNNNVENNGNISEKDNTESETNIKDKLKDVLVDKDVNIVQENDKTNTDTIDDNKESNSKNNTKNENDSNNVDKNRKESFANNLGLYFCVPLLVICLL